MRYLTLTKGEKCMLESYLSKVVVMFIGAGCAIVGTAGGFYATYQLITLIGA
jgi:hypothetical protein